MTDPLSLLRQYVVLKKEIVEENNQIILGETLWSKSALTNLLKFGTGKDGKRKEYYTLDSLLFFHKNKSLSHPEYIRRAAAENIPHVHRPDRRDLLAYFNGDIATCARIDRSAPLEIPTQIKRSGTDDSHESVDKKPRLKDVWVPKDLLVNAYITEINNHYNKEKFEDEIPDSIFSNKVLILSWLEDQPGEDGLQFRQLDNQNEAIGFQTPLLNAYSFRFLNCEMEIFFSERTACLTYLQTGAGRSVSFVDLNLGRNRHGDFYVSKEFCQNAARLFATLWDRFFHDMLLPFQKGAIPKSALREYL